MTEELCSGSFCSRPVFLCGIVHHDDTIHVEVCRILREHAVGHLKALVVVLCRIKQTYVALLILLEVVGILKILPPYCRHAEPNCELS